MTCILGVLVLSPGNHWVHTPPLQREEVRHRAGKLLAEGCIGWVAGPGLYLVHLVSQVNTPSTQDAAGPRLPTREVLEEKRRERFDLGKQFPRPSHTPRGLQGPRSMSTDF